MAKPKLRKILPVDIQKYHPKFLGSCPTDRYYVEVANELYAKLNAKAEMMPEGVNVRDMAIRLTMYFEDVISQGPTWKTFVYLNRKLYGRNLPFFPEEDAPDVTHEYYDDEVNFDDVRFIMWAIIQQMNDRDTLINPHTPGLALIALDVFDFLYDKFEIMPINPALSAMLNVIPAESYEAYLHNRSLMEWILLRNYLLTDVDVEYSLDEIKDVIKVYAMGLSKGEMLDYSTRMEAVFTLPCGPLSLYPKQWLSAMLKVASDDKALAERVLNIDFKKIDLYHIESSDKDFVNLKDCYNNLYKVATHSFADTKQIRNSEGIITSIAHFDAGWWYVNGSAILMPEAPSLREWRGMKEESKYGMKLDNDKAAPVTKEQYIKFFKGKRHSFFASQRDMLIAMTPKEQLDSDSPKYRQLLSEADAETPIFAYVCDDGQLFISEYLAEILPARDNPYRLKTDEAKKELFAAVMGYEIDAEVIQYIIDKGWAKTLAMNSVKGKQEGKRLLQENISFLNRFLHHSKYFCNHTDCL